MGSLKRFLYPTRCVDASKNIFSKHMHECVNIFSKCGFLFMLVSFAERQPGLFDSISKMRFIFKL